MLPAAHPFLHLPVKRSGGTDDVVAYNMRVLQDSKVPAQPLLPGVQPREAQPRELSNYERILLENRSWEEYRTSDP